MKSGIERNPNPTTPSLSKLYRSLEHRATTMRIHHPNLTKPTKLIHEPPEPRQKTPTSIRRAKRREKGLRTK